MTGIAISWNPIWRANIMGLWISLESPCKRVINSVVTIIRISLSPLPPYQGLNHWLGIRKYGPYLDKKHRTIVMRFLTYWKDIEGRVHWHQSSKPGQNSWQIQIISSCLFYSFGSYKDNLCLLYRYPSLLGQVLSRHQFLEMLLRVADQRFIQTGTRGHGVHGSRNW